MEEDLSMHSSRAKTCALDLKQDIATDGRRFERIGHWFDRWYKPIRHWIGRNTSVTAAEIDDLTQDVFMRLLRYSNDVTVTNPKAYLFTIAMNVVGAWQNRARVRMPHDDAELAALQLDTQFEPEPMLERAQSQEELWAAVARLPTRRRELLLLHVREGLTYKQIAQQKNLTYRTVLRDLTRAYVTLRKQFAADALRSPLSEKSASGDPRNTAVTSVDEQ